MRFQVCKQVYHSRTVNERMDPTEIHKNDAPIILSEHSTLDEAKKALEKLEEEQRMVYEEMDAYYAPSECYSHIEKRDLYIVDSLTNDWYTMFINPDTGDPILQLGEEPKETGWEM